MAKNALDWIALVLVIIGGLELGIMAISPATDVLGYLGALGARIANGLIGLAALYTIYLAVKD